MLESWIDRYASKSNLKALQIYTEAGHHSKTITVKQLGKIDEECRCGKGTSGRSTSTSTSTSTMQTDTRPAAVNPTGRPTLTLNRSKFEPDPAHQR